MSFLKSNKILHLKKGEDTILTLNAEASLFFLRLTLSPAQSGTWGSWSLYRLMLSELTLARRVAIHVSILKYGNDISDSHALCIAPPYLKKGSEMNDG